jgi:hypothetical protein
MPAAYSTTIRKASLTAWSLASAVLLSVMTPTPSAVALMVSELAKKMWQGRHKKQRSVKKKYRLEILMIPPELSSNPSVVFAEFGIDDGIIQLVCQAKNHP